MLTNIFVYGTLMRGGVRHSVIRDAKPLSILLAEIDGSLVDCGEYPGLVRGQGTVHGELVEFDPQRFPIEELDRIEGYQEGGSDNLYERQLVSVRVGPEVKEAWVYYLAANDQFANIVGCWREWIGVRAEILRAIVREHFRENDRLKIRGELLLEGQCLEMILSGQLSEFELARVSGLYNAAVQK